MGTGTRLAFTGVAASAITAIAFVTLDPMREPAPESGHAVRMRMEALEREVRELRDALVRSEGAPRETPSLVGQRGDKPSPARTEAAPEAPPAAMVGWNDKNRRQKERVADWRQRIVQITDAAGRESALQEVALALREQDAATVETALMVFADVDLADVTLDREVLRTLVVPHLASDLPRIPWRAAAALRQLRPQPEDFDRILDRVERDRHPELLLLPYLLSGDGVKRAEGRVADLFVRLLTTDDPNQALQIAATLSDVHVTLHLHDAVVAAFQRHGAAETRGTWLLALARVLPRREPGVEAVFELLSAPDPENLRHGYVMDCLAGGIADDVRPLAARRAAELLAGAPTQPVRRAALRALDANGGREQAGVVRRFAENPMNPESERAQARRVLERLESR